MNFLLDPLQYSFIVRALIAAIIVGIVCSVLGTYIVLRGMAFFGDALAHTILPGVVIAFLLGWPPLCFCRPAASLPLGRAGCLSTSLSVVVACLIVCLVRVLFNSFFYQRYLIVGIVQVNLGESVFSTKLPFLQTLHTPVHVPSAALYLFGFVSPETLCHCPLPSSL